jgi:hypothetical protein
MDVFFCYNIFVVSDNLTLKGKPNE